MELHDAVLRPLLCAVPESACICFLPEGPLWDVPWHALQGPGGQHLISQRPCVFGSSIEALLRIHGSRPPLYGSALGHRPLVVAAGANSPQMALNGAPRPSPHPHIPRKPQEPSARVNDASTASSNALLPFTAPRDPLVLSALTHRQQPPTTANDPSSGVFYQDRRAAMETVEGLTLNETGVEMQPDLSALLGQRAEARSGAGLGVRGTAGTRPSTASPCGRGPPGARHMDPLSVAKEQILEALAEASSVHITAQYYASRRLQSRTHHPGMLWLGGHGPSPSAPPHRGSDLGTGTHTATPCPPTHCTATSNAGLCLYCEELAALRLQQCSLAVVDIDHACTAEGQDLAVLAWSLSVAGARHVLCPLSAETGRQSFLTMFYEELLRLDPGTQWIVPVALQRACCRAVGSGMPVSEWAGVVCFGLP